MPHLAANMSSSISTKMGKNWLILNVRTVGIKLAVLAVFTLITLGSQVSARSAPGPVSQVTSESEKIDDLLRLLGDNDIQEWLRDRQQARPEVAVGEPAGSLGAIASQRLQEIQLHFRALFQAVPKVPGEIVKAGNNIRAASAGYGFFSILLLAASFVGFGLIAEWLFKIAVQRTIAARPEATEVAARLANLARRALLAIGGVAAFAVGSTGAFLVFEWPNLLRTIVLNFLVAGLLFSLAWNLMAVLLAPRLAAMRVIPMSDDFALHLRNRIALAIGWFGFGYSTVQVLVMTQVDQNVVRLVAYVLGVGLLVIGIETVWRRPAELNEAVSHTASGIRLGAGRKWFYSACIAVLWLLWVAGAMRLFWLIAVALALPLLFATTRSAVNNLLQVGDGHRLVATAIERGLRTVWIIGAVAVLAWAWGVGFEHLANRSDPTSAVLQAIVTVLAILIALDLIWQLIKTMIDASLERSTDLGQPGSQLSIKQAKIRTLLPILRNVSMIFLATLAVLMVLSSLGVEIAPLIASAGVVGIAIGFGAQTLVKDVISGMFYLLDDAFRVGEYIVTGNFRGTVESFSLRSVRLRHHRGPVFTIPFGELGTVQNMSRDFVVDKLMINVTYDSDIENARKLLKQIGQQLAEDPDLAPTIIEPLKMQRIGDFGEYGIQLIVKVTTKPGEQFALRRKAYPLIKKAFEENGIKFAYPTVKIAESESQSAAAVQHVISRKASVQKQPR